MESSTRTAVVTGGASGIGRSVCEHLAAQGHRIGVLDANAEAAEKLVAELRSAGAQALAVEVDVADAAAITTALRAVREAFGPVGILVTSAGLGGFTPFEEITLDDFNRYVAVNLTGTFLCIQGVLPDMASAGWGRIVTISSAAGQTGAVNQGHYATTKGGVIALTKTVALEYAARGITVNTIPPFVTDTPMLRGQQEAKKLPPEKILSRAIPMGRLGSGDDIAAMCAFLCTDAAGYVTGQVIGVNGGAVV
jgi:2-hydroxycyclohexanecarboxyl-CoA dehydrogenase